MALLRDSRSGRVVAVPGELLIGRGPTCTLRLDDRTVSSQHATLAWSDDGRWELRDLGSRNGTFVDGARVAPGEPVPVGPGARIGFGDPADAWVLSDAGAPDAAAERLTDGRVVAARDGVLLLPDEDAPDVEIHPDGRGGWRVEDADGDARVIDDGEVVHAGGTAWRVRLPVAVEGTVAVDTGPRLASCQLRFRVSQDEEHVQCIVVHRGEEIPLDAREHWYPILVLARARADDAAQPAGEQGWLDRDQLLRMLQLDPNGLNVAIYRARRQLRAAGVDDAADIVEVRRGQRRLGVEADRLAFVPM